MSGGAGILGVELGSRDPPALAAFYREAFGFADEDKRDDDSIRLSLGPCQLRLRASTGRVLPADSSSRDRWFRHLAIVVSDIDAAWSALRRFGLDSISDSIQTLPKWNPAVAGIRALYFRDPEAHPLELIQYPQGRGRPQWQRRDALFLGVDHTAIVVADSAASIAFYRHYGLSQREAGSINSGIEQARLAAVPEARVRVTPLAGGGDGEGIGLELLEYLHPLDGRRAPADTTADDAWLARTLIAGTNLESTITTVDPDGHGVRSP